MYENDPNYYSIFVPENKFTQYWDNDVVDYEWAGKEDEDEDEDNGWIFWYKR